MSDKKNAIAISLFLVVLLGVFIFFNTNFESSNTFKSSEDTLSEVTEDTPLSTVTISPSDTSLPLDTSLPSDIPLPVDTVILPTVTPTEEQENTVLEEVSLLYFVA